MEVLVVFLCHIRDGPYILGESESLALWSLPKILSILWQNQIHVNMSMTPYEGSYESYIKNRNLDALCKVWKKCQHGLKEAKWL